MLSAVLLTTLAGGRAASQAMHQPHAAHAAPVARRADSLPPFLDSDNRRPAGALQDGVLTLRLEARRGVWHPEGPAGIGIPVAAFAEEGRAPQNPGPLVRVPAGTGVRLTVRNSLATPLTLFGLGEQRRLAADSVRVEPGAVREVHFRASEPGTYYYAGKTTPVPVLVRGGDDSQLNGAIVVDPARPSGLGPAAVHWHRIELGSTADGVPAWSGTNGSIMPAIAPGDSATVRFTPPRAGTFMHHSHFDELGQISSGLYGTIIGVEPAARSRSRASCAPA